MLSGRVQALAGLAAIIAVAALALWLARASPPKPADADPTEFSALRAMRHVESLAATPHPSGTRAHRGARAYVVGELERLGWRVEVDDTWTRKWRGPLLRYARLSNILASHPQATGPPAILLASHYDSVPTGPGAGDASAPVAAILEALRALGADPDARRIGVLITDGEEAGLLGAKAFAEDHPWMDGVELVLNFEARGNAGVPWMFETGDGASRLVSGFGRAVPRPFANSLSTAIYRRMPNDTDYSIFRDRGVQGLNMAMIGDHPAYHSQLDTPGNLDRASLQSLGEAVLGLARSIPTSDWRRSRKVSTFFNPVGSWFVVYPVQIDQAVLVIGIFFAAWWLWGRAVRPFSGVALAFAVWLAVIVPVGLAWWLLVRLFPAVIEAPNGVPYEQTLLILGWLSLSCAAAMFFAGWMQRDAQAATGGLVMLSLLGIASVVWIPEATYMIAWPLLTMAAAAWLTVFDASRRWLWWTLGALPVPLLYAPLAREALLGLTPHAAWVVAGMVGVGLFALMPLLARFATNPVSWRWVLVGVGVALILACGITAKADSETPRPLRLAYAVPPDDSPQWISRTRRLDPWLEESVGSAWLESDWTLRDANGVGDLGVRAASIATEQAWVAAAPVTPGLTDPEIRALAVGSDENGRWLDVEFGATRGGQQLWIELSGAVVSRVQWLGQEKRAVDDGPIRHLLILAPRQRETLRLWAEGATPVWVTAHEVTYGLPPVAPAIPDFLIQSSSWTDYAVRVGARSVIDDR